MPPTMFRLLTPSESKKLFDHASKLKVQYHKKYKNYGKTFVVPRGQAAFTLKKGIKYAYGQAGGSPPVSVMTKELKAVTRKLNSKLKTTFNTILLNIYKNGDDCIHPHHDNTNGWTKGSGFATLALGSSRIFRVRTRKTRKDFKHESGSVIYMTSAQNRLWTHSVPKMSNVGCRISLTFRSIEE